MSSSFCMAFAIIGEIWVNYIELPWTVNEHPTTNMNTVNVHYTSYILHKYQLSVQFQLNIKLACYLMTNNDFVLNFMPFNLVTLCMFYETNELNFSNTLCIIMNLSIWFWFIISLQLWDWIHCVNSAKLLI